MAWAMACAMAWALWWVMQWLVEPLVVGLSEELLAALLVMRLVMAPLEVDKQERELREGEHSVADLLGEVQRVESSGVQWSVPQQATRLAMQ